MRRLRSFGAFWYDFVVGDDWRMALVVAFALLATGLVAHFTSVAAWWILPLAVVAVVAESLRRATRHSPRDRHSP